MFRTPFHKFDRHNYGLAKTYFEGDDRLTIEVSRDDVEDEENAYQGWLSGLALLQLQETSDRLVDMKDEVAAKIDGYTGVDRGWSIKYDPDEETIAYHQAFAEIYAAGTPEAETFPDTARFNSRSFGSLKSTSVRQLGRVLHHVACATRLKATTPGLQLRNLLTIFARKEDIFKLWNSEENDPDWTRRIVDAMTLDANSAREIEAEFEIPVPYYIDIGKDFVLLPLFGGLLNPHAGMVHHLRRHYRKDWDRSTNSRERALRRELPSVFPSPRYRVPDRNTNLRRGDGSSITDIDAVILDDETGELALVQLKCFDIYGRSLKERDSRRKSILEANTWVEKVTKWVAGRSSRDVARAIGLKGGGDSPPEIVVLTRRTMMFTRETGYDKRAHWFSWPRLVAERTAQPYATLRELFASHSSAPTDRNQTGAQRKTRYDLYGLQVEILEVSQFRDEGNIA